MTANKPDPGPSALTWLAGFLSVLLPWIGAGIALAGIYRLVHDLPSPWLWIAVGTGLVVLDLAVDLMWARRGVVHSEEPHLNARTAQLVGRTLIVEEAIVHGRGKVRSGDTVWAAEGADAPQGARVRVIDAKATVLVVTPE